MTARSKDDFALAPIPPVTDWLAPGDPFSYRELPLTLAERRSGVEARKHLQIIEQERQKGLAAHAAIEAISESQLRTLAHVVDHTWAVCQQARDPIPQLIVQDYWERTVVRTESYLEAVSDRVVSRIADTVSRSTYVDRVPSSVGILARIRGKDNGV